MWRSITREEVRKMRQESRGVAKRLREGILDAQRWGHPVSEMCACGDPRCIYSFQACKRRFPLGCRDRSGGGDSG